MLATFIGHDGSMGLKHGKVYDIEVVHNVYDPQLVRVIWQSQNRLYRFFYNLIMPYHYHCNSCSYTNMESVKENWALSYEDWYTAFLWITDSGNEVVMLD